MDPQLTFNPKNQSRALPNLPLDASSPKTSLATTASFIPWKELDAALSKDSRPWPFAFGTWFSPLPSYL
jgi:hypothetical protein